MSAFSVRFDRFVNGWNILTPATDRIEEFFAANPTTHKVALLANHLFRAAMMVGFMFIPGLPCLPGMAICFVGSVFYRLTIERNCAYKFALPALAGATAFMIALPSIMKMVQGVAFISAASGALCCASFIPLMLYGSYIVLTVNHDVNKTHRQPQQTCASKCSKAH